MNASSFALCVSIFVLFDWTAARMSSSVAGFLEGLVVEVEVDDEDFVEEVEVEVEDELLRVPDMFFEEGFAVEFEFEDDFVEEVEDERFRGSVAGVMGFAAVIQELQTSMVCSLCVTLRNCAHPGWKGALQRSQKTGCFTSSLHLPLHLYVRDSPGANVAAIIRVGEIFCFSEVLL